MPQRHTVQKDIIYAALTELGNHPTADMVYDHVYAEHPSISRATVFRVLRQLSENGTIRRVAMFDGADCYDHCLLPHCHARCLECRRVFDVFCELPPVQSFLHVEDSGFELTDYSLLLEGICPDCKCGKKEA